MPPPEPTAAAHSDDSRLLGEIGRGNEAALAAFIRIHGGAITRFAARYLGAAAEAEDVAQEVFLRVWRNAAGFDPAKGSGRTWLYRIATNLCLDQRRRRWFRWAVGIDDLVPHLPDEAPSAYRVIAGRDGVQALRQSLRDLPHRQRLALLLAAVEGLDTAEIAGIMGLSRGAVEQLLVRARRRLRAKMAEGDSGSHLKETRPR
ncbi:MAG: sigma-70 family RNA polymerase sigma factor [Tabrizicola sp.]|nr:sigma-70 family RNA polymerase sigma factor [Tabrizicola sp.]